MKDSSLKFFNLETLIVNKLKLIVKEEEKIQ